MVILTLVHLRPFYFLDFTAFIEIWNGAGLLKRRTLTAFPLCPRYRYANPYGTGR